ncbi:hypothetical protein [Synechococcus sp. BIOS-E4-1]|uniref:hypothetical protein n=1 Tax=Synechococcus sp. BIOS-E4-1 TaxID=1400864 RepID=UPI0016462E1E|nr:hypothetical protein [Synechococcus sp. BIOS-E4-1]
MVCTDCSVLSVSAIAMTTTTSDQKRSRRPRYWVGPLVAGACFALGYGITQRVVLMRQAWEKPQQATFRQNSFPGESLDGLRRRYGSDQPLMGDVAAKEVLDAEQRKANEQAEAIAQKAKQREQAQQAAVPEPWAVREDPVSTAAPVATPAPDVGEQEGPDGSQPAAVLTPNSEPVVPEPAPGADPAIEPSLQAAPEPRPAAVATPEPAVTPTRPAIDESLIFKAPPATPPAAPPAP